MSGVHEQSHAETLGPMIRRKSSGRATTPAPSGENRIAPTGSSVNATPADAFDSSTIKA